MSRIDISLFSFTDIKEISATWIDLYSVSQKSPFHSWSWIKNYFVSSKDCRYQIIQAQKDGSVVGLGVISTVSRYTKKTLYLNRTGVEQLDQPWVEYNDFLLHKDVEQPVRLALVDFLINQTSWDELVVGASLKTQLAPYALYDLQATTLWYSHTYQINLTAFANGEAYLQSLSRNTRYQINRSYKEYTQYGEVSFTRARSLQDALSWFDEAAPHHKARWQNTDVGSGFNNPYFVEFHRNLIADSFDDGNIDILKVTAGDRAITYLYNFKQKDSIYFYLSANVYDDSLSHTKPGLVGHYLAIAYYIEQGFKCYDFMGGESQYKRSLSTNSKAISIKRFSRSGIKHRLVDSLRSLKAKRTLANTHVSLPEREVIITGGTLNREDRPTYSKGLVVKAVLGSDGRIKESGRVTYKHREEYCAQDTNVIFKSASFEQSQLVVTSETELFEIDVPTMTIQRRHSFAQFNDLHHALPFDNKIFIANTGLDNIAVFDESSSQCTFINTVSGALDRTTHDTDYRQLASTKPHLAHPNFCFVLNNEVWVTRCDFMDAVSLTDLTKRIFIGDGLVHDGVVSGKYLYFSTVNGHIKAFNKDSRELCIDFDIATVAPQYTGWFRGLAPLGNGQILMAMSQSRQSKRLTSASSGSVILLIDLFNNAVLAEWTLGHLGLDAVFSVLLVPQQ